MCDMLQLVVENHTQAVILLVTKQRGPSCTQHRGNATQHGWSSERDRWNSTQRWWNSTQHGRRSTPLGWSQRSSWNAAEDGWCFSPRSWSLYSVCSSRPRNRSILLTGWSESTRHRPDPPTLGVISTPQGRQFQERHVFGSRICVGPGIWRSSTT